MRMRRLTAMILAVLILTTFAKAETVASEYLVNMTAEEVRALEEKLHALGYLAAAVLGSRKGTLATALFLLIGLIGLPVFSGFIGGPQKLIGPTGGYLIGYLPGAWIGGLGVKAGQTEPDSKWRLPLCLALATLVIYILGTVWFVLQSGKTLAGALSLCVFPFLPGDAIKIIAVSLLAWPIRKALYH